MKIKSWRDRAPSKAVLKRYYYYRVETGHIQPNDWMPACTGTATPFGQWAEGVVGMPITCAEGPVYRLKSKRNKR